MGAIGQYIGHGDAITQHWAKIQPPGMRSCLVAARGCERPNRHDHDYKRDHAPTPAAPNAHFHPSEAPSSPARMNDTPAPRLNEEV